MSKKKILILIVTISVLFIATVSFLIIKNKTDKMEKFEINNNENNEENNTENNTKNESKEDNDPNSNDVNIKDTIMILLHLKKMLLITLKKSMMKLTIILGMMLKIKLKNILLL